MWRANESSASMWQQEIRFNYEQLLIDSYWGSNTSCTECVAGICAEANVDVQFEFQCKISEFCRTGLLEMPT